MDPVDNFGTVVGENPDCLLLSGTVVSENPDHVWHCLLGTMTDCGILSPTADPSFLRKQTVIYFLMDI